MSLRWILNAIRSIVTDKCYIKWWHLQGAELKWNSRTHTHKWNEISTIWIAYTQVAKQFCHFITSRVIKFTHLRLLFGVECNHYELIPLPICADARLLFAFIFSLFLSLSLSLLFATSPLSSSSSCCVCVRFFLFFFTFNNILAR